MKTLVVKCKKTKLIQILLPLYNKEGKPFQKALYSKVKIELREKFGGLTSFTRSPASGLWKTHEKIEHDDIIIYEVMTSQTEPKYWSDYKKLLEKRFMQKELVIGFYDIELL